VPAVAFNSTGCSGALRHDLDIPVGTSIHTFNNVEMNAELVTCAQAGVTTDST
jgi:hypothetical protein